MSDLLTLVLAAHGGLDKWRELQTASAAFAIEGELLDLKAPTKRIPLQATVSLHEQRAWMSPFGGPDQRSAFSPQRVAIEKTNGGVLAERLNPRTAFAGHGLDTRWDPLHQAYFGGYAMWIYLNAPFMFRMPGVECEEIEPIREKDETWRGLRVTLPERLVSHSPVQDFYFGEDHLLRRQDYSLDVAGGYHIANYALDIVVSNGLRIPRKRRAYLCDDRYRVMYDRLLIRIYMTDVQFN